MKALREHLKNAYEEHTRAHNQLNQLTFILQKNKQTLSPTLQHILTQLHIIAYRHEVLTIAIPPHLISPEIGYHTNEIKKLFSVYGNKPIHTIRIIPKTTQVPV